MTETGTEINLYDRLGKLVGGSEYMFSEDNWDIVIDESDNVTIKYKGTELNITFIVDKDMTIQSYQEDSMSNPKDLNGNCTVIFNEKINIKNDKGNGVKLKVNGARLVIKNEIEIEDNCELECSTLEIV